MPDRRRQHGRLASRSGEGQARQVERRRSERRSSQRVPAEILVEVETRGLRTYRRTANISLGGVGFHAPIPFHKGSLVGMTLHAAGRSQPIRVQGEVVGSDQAGRGVRVCFVDPNLDARQALEEHLRLYQAPTRIGPAPLPPGKGASRHQVREGILIMEGDSLGREFRLRGSDKVIGRDRGGADLLIDHPSISRLHAHVCLQNGRHVITDLSSTNGIRFQGKRVHSLVLRDGMVVKLGAVPLQYLVTRAIKAHEAFAR